MNLHLVLLLAYSVLQVWLGLWIGRQVRSTGDFFVAGRRLGPWLLFSTLVAANIGAGSTVGAAGLGYRDGISAWWWVGSAGIGCIALGLLVGPRIRRVAAENDLRTAGDYLEHRYSREVRGLISVLLWFGTIAILAGQLIALAWVLNVVAGLPKWAGCVIGGLVATTYFAAGGLLTSAWVNAVQVVVMLVGFGAALPTALERVGGWATVAAQPAPDGYWNFWQGGASGWLYVVLLAPAFVISPGLLQKVYGARDDRTVRVAVLGDAAVLLVFAFIPPLLGMTARSLHPGLDNHELALPVLLMRDLPPLLGSLGLAAVVSAEVSTADAILFMLATSLSQDLYRRFLNPTATDAQVLKVARLAAVAGGVLGVGVAVAAPSVIGVLSIFYSVLTVSLFVPIVAGLYSSRMGTREALAAIACGVLVMLATHLGTEGRGFGAASPVVVGLAAAALAALAAAFLPRRQTA